MVNQVGGDHYKASYGHWDWVCDIGLGYLAGNATKYIARWRKKNGRQDLEKALSYLNKMIEVGVEGWGGVPASTIGHLNVIAKTVVLANSAHLHEIDHRICVQIATAIFSDDLSEPLSAIENLIADAPKDTEEAAMRAHSMRLSDNGDGQPVMKRVEHPAPFGYEGDG